MRAVALVFATLLLSHCVYPATEVLITVGSDAPEDRALTFTVHATGSNSSSAMTETHSWTRGGPMGNITLPASFAIVPAGSTENVSLVFEARVAPGTSGQPAIVFRRTARFPFTTHVTTGVRVFLRVSCGAASTGCTSVSAAECTVSTYCEDHGLTCGDDGTCSTPDVTPIPIPPGSTDVAIQTDMGVDATRDVADVIDVPVARDVIDVTEISAPDVTDVPDASGPTWWNTAWTHRVRVTAHNGQSEALVDFPLRIRVDPTRFDPTFAAGDGSDLRFIASDQVTNLSYEFESYARGTGDFWVRVPRIEPNGDYVFWMYFGNPSAKQLGTGSDVWTSSYAAVLHLTDMHDSTVNHNDAIDHVSTTTTGQIGSARAFASSLQAYLMIANSGSLHPLNNAATISVWSRPTALDTTTYRASVTRSPEDGTSADDFWIGNYTFALYLEPSTTTMDRIMITGTAISQDVWHQETFVIDHSTVIGYVNGVESVRQTVPGDLRDDPTSIVIGADVDHATADTPNDDFIDGEIDELRIETVVRSGAWIAGDYASMTDTVCSFGGVETVP